MKAIFLTEEFGQEEGDREATGTTPENENEPETVRAFYDAT